MIGETNRLKLDEFSVSDATFIVELLNSPSWIKYIGDRGVRTIEDAGKYIHERLIKNYNFYGFGFWKVSLKENGAPIGMCGLIKREGLEDVDIGFAFLPEFQSQGYGSEAALVTIDVAKRKFDLNRLVAITQDDNEGSIRLLEKLGFAYEKMVKLPQDEKELMLFGISL